MSWKGLVEKIEELKVTEPGKLVKDRIFEFKKLGNADSSEIFKELCFCILTANYTAEGGMRIQNAMGDKFLTFSEKHLAKELKKLGHRFPNTRANYIQNAQKYRSGLKSILGSIKDEVEIRQWLVKNIKGLGYKEASHFMRNIGYLNTAIVDFHIIDLAERYNLIKKPKTLTKSKYLEIEKVLRDISRKSSLTLAELDLYLWFIETGKILK